MADKFKPCAACYHRRVPNNQEPCQDCSEAREWIFDPTSVPDSLKNSQHTVAPMGQRLSVLELNYSGLETRVTDIERWLSAGKEIANAIGEKHE